jgi:hypothetical protein
MSMKKKRMNWVKAVFFGCLIGVSGACNDDDSVPGKGEVEFEITDAASDDANIKSVMVTVADVKVNGVSIEGFSKQTIDLKAYNEGNTKLLGHLNLDAKAYNNITLILDLDQDANGNEPGCYVLTQDNFKYKLKSTATGATEIALNKSWNVVSNAKTKVVMDFDLRKALAYSAELENRYSFVTDENLRAAVRVVTYANAGTIKGTYQEDAEVDAEKIIVYAYRKGTFNSEVETQAQGEDQIMFKNAVSSAEVRQSLTGTTYTLAFLEEGDYELHFAAYDQNTETGRFAYAAHLQSETSVDGSVGNIIHVKGGASINISSSITGFF